uniref:Leucine-rich repeats and calponin homology (CH) domain containing 3 n=1 Tax=Echeneis naucrates TaxID=173247 RepID=A0A665U834_ECHNA
MAASVLLGSADNTGLSFTVGAGGAGNVLVGNNNGLGSVGPAPWNRSLDRALDEASATGCLNLSGRKLKEFPRSAANHDLTDTTRADLSRNRLSELPMEVCLFVSLESLNLYQNCLRSLPDSLLNLQALTYLNLSRNQLSLLPVVICSLPLKVLIICNNKLVSLPEELGQLRHLTELDVSCNEIQILPSQVGQLEALRDLNIRRNHLVRLPPELAELPLVHLDFSCNKVTSIPTSYRRLTQLQTIVLDNNPLQTPPAQICIKGKVHIFKYLNLEASKTPDLPDYDRRPLTFNSCGDELYPSRQYGALDSGFNSVDSGDKRWSGNEPTEELSELPQRVAEISRDQRLRPAGGVVQLLANGTHVELEQIDFIDSCAGEEEEEEGRSQGGRGGDSASLSCQFMAYIERRITREVRALPRQRTQGDTIGTHTPKGGVSPRGVERMRREAQLAALRYDEERQKNHSLMKDNVTSYTKVPPVKSVGRMYNCPMLSLQGEDRAALSPTANRSPSYPSSGGGFSCRMSSLRPESFLKVATQEEAPVAPPFVGEDAELVEQLRKNIEARLKVSLSSDLGSALTDGVVLCHLANHVRPRSVPSIHVPSPAVPKLTMAKCRRNVENFLEACRRIGVPQSQLCLPLHILEERGLPQVAGTVSALLNLAPPRHPVSTTTTTSSSSSS